VVSGGSPCDKGVGRECGLSKFLSGSMGSLDEVPVIPSPRVSVGME
jgi:hypothetical protein